MKQVDHSEINIALTDVDKRLNYTNLVVKAFYIIEVLKQAANILQYKTLSFC